MIKGTDDFSLVFTFRPNEFFDTLKVTKRYYIDSSGNVTKIDCNDLCWKNGKKPNSDDETFFEFFLSKSKEQLCENGEMDVDEDYDLGSEIKDELLNLALEYYLNIVEPKAEIEDE